MASPHYLGQIVWYEHGYDGCVPAIIILLHGEPDTHRVDLHRFGPTGGSVEKSVPFGTEKGTWRFPEIPKP